VLLASEDDIAATVRPRLRIAGASLRRVATVRGVTLTDATTGQTLARPFLLPQDIPYLETSLHRVDARLVVIDPLMAYLDSKVNSWRDQEALTAGIILISSRLLLFCPLPQERNQNQRRSGSPPSLEEGLGERVADKDRNEMGISSWRLGEARKKLDITMSRVGFGPGSYQVWSLPQRTVSAVLETPPAVATAAPYLGLDDIAVVSLKNQSYGSEPKVCENDE
jgi:hypothetical protein